MGKAKKKCELLAELHVLEKDHTERPDGEKIDVLGEPYPALPLWRRVDKQFWWNEWLSKPFVDAGVGSPSHNPTFADQHPQLHPYVLPIMQGYYQITNFRIPREPVAREEGTHALVDYIVVSRRSRDRAGLRYQRRGVDDEAHVANFVETEAITKVDVSSFVKKSHQYKHLS